MTSYLIPSFKLVSVIFAIASVLTGIQAIVDPNGFSRSFGIPLSSTEVMDPKSITLTRSEAEKQKMAVTPYVSLMGVRQLATGVILLTFAYQEKWREMATILSIIGILIAGTDGIYLSRFGAKNQAKIHAIPGALIAALGGAAIYSGI